MVINYDLPKPQHYLYHEYLHRISKCSNQNCDTPNFVINMISPWYLESKKMLEDFYKFKMIELENKSI